MTNQILMDISDNGGYSPSQIKTDFTLGDLLEAVEEAISVYGPDPVIVLSNGQRYGAGYGSIANSRSEMLFYFPEETEGN